MKTKRVSYRAGFTLVEVVIAAGVIGILACMIVPSVTRARTTAYKRACFSNLHVIDDAKEQWAFENKKSVGSRSKVSEINDYIRGGAPKCPIGGRYRYRPMDTYPSCEIMDHNLFTDYGGLEDEE
jgi:prepilin-type N-terminal cleavage/methylation domain-containing protein